MSKGAADKRWEIENEKKRFVPSSLSEQATWVQHKKVPFIGLSDKLLRFQTQRTKSILCECSPLPSSTYLPFSNGISIWVRRHTHMHTHIAGQFVPHNTHTSRSRPLRCAVHSKCTNETVKRLIRDALYHSCVCGSCWLDLQNQDPPVLLVINVMQKQQSSVEKRRCHIRNEVKWPDAEIIRKKKNK